LAIAFVAAALFLALALQVSFGNPFWLFFPVAVIASTWTPCNDTRHDGCISYAQPGKAMDAKLWVDDREFRAPSILACGHLSDSELTKAEAGPPHWGGDFK